MQIIHITTVHNRYDTRIFHRECVNLAKLDSVTLLVIDGFKSENKQNVNIISLKKSESKFVNLWRVFKWLYSKRKVENVVLHLHDPELYLCSPIFKLLGYKVVLDIHEDYEKQILLKTYISSVYLRKLLSSIYKYFEKLILHFADLSVVPVPSFLNKSKSILVGNFMTVKEIEDLKNLKAVSRDNSFIYSGGISEERGLFNLLNLAVKLHDYGYIIKIAGKFQNKNLKAKAMSHDGWKYVKFLGYMERSELLLEQKKSSAGLILFNNLGQYGLAFSVKLFEYAACDLPVLMPNFGDWPLMNDEYSLGVNVNVDDITDEDILNLIKLGDDPNFKFRASEFLNTFSLEDNISTLYANYIRVLNGD